MLSLQNSKGGHCRFVLFILILEAGALVIGTTNPENPDPSTGCSNPDQHGSQKTFSRTCESAPKNCPFDDLSSAEIQKVISIVRGSGKFSADIQYSVVKTQEPMKADWQRGDAVNTRLAYAALFNLQTNTITEVVINLRTSVIANLHDLDAGITPIVLATEYAKAEEIVRADISWQKAIAKRGVDPADAKFDIWAPGVSFTPIEAQNSSQQRLFRVITSYNGNKSRFWYWNVIEGFITTIDLMSGKVIELWDDDQVSLPPGSSEQTVSNNPPLKPLLVSQPAGSSIQVSGFQVQWYKWKFQYSMDPVQGLQLYHVRYNADCHDRMVLYKFGLSEMFVPYGAQGRTWRWRNAFDVGEYGVGKTAKTLAVGVDLPENAILLNCVFADEAGGVTVEVPGCIGAFERDTGPLFTHTDTNTGDTDGRRGRELVLTFTTTAGNYDYAFDYVLHMDGSMKIKVRLTGVILARGSNQTANSESCLLNKEDACATLLDRNLIGPAHQHFFNFRMDFDIDGTANYVEEVNVKSDDGPDIGPDDPFAGTFSAYKNLLLNETHRDHDFRSDRNWHVVNRHSTNDFNTPRGYALRKHETTTAYLPASSPLGQKSLFIQHPFWATVYKDDEQRAAGDFPRTSPAGQGLPVFIYDNQSLLDTDVVIWYTFGMTHVPKAEEWPIMTMHTAGFSMIPFNFLSRNAEMPLKNHCKA